MEPRCLRLSLSSSLCNELLLHNSLERRDFTECTGVRLLLRCVRRDGRSVLCSSFWRLYVPADDLSLLDLFSQVFCDTMSRLLPELGNTCWLCDWTGVEMVQLSVACSSPACLCESDSLNNCILSKPTETTGTFNSVVCGKCWGWGHCGRTESCLILGNTQEPVFVA